MQRLVKLLFQNHFVSSSQECFASISPVLLLSLSSRLDAPFKDKGYLFPCDKSESVFGKQKYLSESTEELEKFLKLKIEQADRKHVPMERDNLLKDDFDGLCGSLSEPLTSCYGETHTKSSDGQSFKSELTCSQTRSHTLPVEKKRLEIDRDAAEYILETDNIETDDYKLINLTGHYLLGTPRCDFRWTFTPGKKKSWKQVPSFQGTDVTKVKDEENYAQNYSNEAGGMSSGFQRRARKLIDKLKGVTSGSNNPHQSPFCIDNPYVGCDSVTEYTPLSPMAPHEVPPATVLLDDTHMQSSDQTSSVQNHNTNHFDETATANAVVLPPRLTAKQFGTVEQEKYWTLMQLFDKNKLVAIRPMDQNILDVWGLKDFFNSRQDMREAVYAKIQNAPLHRSLQEIIDSRGRSSIKYIGEHKDLGFLIMGEHDEILAIVPPKSFSNKTLRQEKTAKEFQSMQDNMIVGCTMAVPEITANDILMTLLVDVPEPPEKNRIKPSNRESDRDDEDTAHQNITSYDVMQFKEMDQLIGGPGSTSDKTDNGIRKEKQVGNCRGDKCDQAPSSGWYPKRSALDTNRPPINVGTTCHSSPKGSTNSGSAIDETVIMSYVRNSPHHKHCTSPEGHFHPRCIGWVLCRPATPNQCPPGTVPSANTMIPSAHASPAQYPIEQPSGYPGSHSSANPQSDYQSAVASVHSSVANQPPSCNTIDQSGYPVTQPSGYASGYAPPQSVPFPNVSHPDMCQSHNYGAQPYSAAGSIVGTLHGQHDTNAGCPWPSHLPCPDVPDQSVSPVGTSTCPWPSYMPCPEIPGNSVHAMPQSMFGNPSQEQCVQPTMLGTQSQHYLATPGAVPSFYPSQQQMSAVPSHNYGAMNPTAPNSYQSQNLGNGSGNYSNLDAAVPTSSSQHSCNHVGCINPCHCVCPSGYASAGNPTMIPAQSALHQPTIHQQMSAAAASGACNASYGIRTCPWVSHVPCPPFPASNASISSIPHHTAAHDGLAAAIAAESAAAASAGAASAAAVPASAPAVPVSFSGSPNHEDTSSFGAGTYMSVASAGSGSGYMPHNAGTSNSTRASSASCASPQWPCVPFCHPCPHSCHLSEGGHTEYLGRAIVMTAAEEGMLNQRNIGGVMVASNGQGLCSKENEQAKLAEEMNTAAKNGHAAKSGHAEKSGSDPSDNANSSNCSKSSKVIPTLPTEALFTANKSLPPNIFDFKMLAAREKAELPHMKGANSRSFLKLSSVSDETSSGSDPKDVFSISTDQTCQLTPSARSLKGLAEDAPKGSTKFCDSVSCSRSISSGEFQPVTRISRKPDDGVLSFYGFRSVEEELQKTSKQLFPELKFYENGLYKILSDLGISESNLGSYSGQWIGSGNTIAAIDPAMGCKIVDVTLPTENEVFDCLQAAKDASKQWANLQPRCRAVVLREIARQLDMKRNELAKLVSLEVGKIFMDALCEVRGVVNMFEYAAGLATVFSGNVFESERPNHLILERFLPLGTTGILAAFNTPLSTFGKSATISLAVGNTVVFKPAETTTLSCIALLKIIEKTLKCFGLPPVVICVQGDRDVGRYLTEDDRIDVLAFSGNITNGQDVGLRAQNRFAKSLLNLTGLNGMIVNHDANFELALNAATLGIVDFAGQKKQKVSHILVHRALYDRFVEELTKRIEKVTAFCGHPLDPRSIFGPLHSDKITKNYIVAVQKIRDSGGQIEVGGNVKYGNFVEPAVVTKVNWAFPIIGPLAFVMPAHNIEEAIEANNRFSNLLSSSVFTKNIADLYRYIGPSGLSGGVISINTANTGTELTVPFGGDRAAGGGRLSGSDMWREYCRRVAININFSSRLPFAHGSSCTLLS